MEYFQLAPFGPAASTMVARAESSEPPPSVEAGWRWQRDRSGRWLRGHRAGPGRPACAVDPHEKTAGQRERAQPARSALRFLSGQTVLMSGQICPDGHVRKSLATRQSDWPPYVRNEKITNSAKITTWQYFHHCCTTLSFGCDEGD